MPSNPKIDLLRRAARARRPQITVPTAPKALTVAAPAAPTPAPAAPPVDPDATIATAVANKVVAQLRAQFRHQKIVDAAVAAVHAQLLAEGIDVRSMNVVALADAAARS